VFFFGVQAYVAPNQVEEEAIDALGVVTESQLEKEDKLKKRRYLLGGICLFVIVLLVIIIPVVVTQGKGSGDAVFVNKTEAPTTAPSEAPTSDIFSELVSTIEELYGETNGDLFLETFTNSQSPQYRAASWAADVAPLGLSGSDPRMISRYALSTLYFALGGDEWEICGRDSTSCSTSEEWLTAENECDWYAIDCNDPSSGDYSVTEIFFRKLDFDVFIVYNWHSLWRMPHPFYPQPNQSVHETQTWLELYPMTCPFYLH
jgi:hypothetical protein